MGDEDYIIGLCDEVLSAKAKREATFPFLLSDIGEDGTRAPLRVDAYYPDRNLVIEYLEVQHFKTVPHWDSRPTPGGGTRGEQRRKYDERRRLVLKAYGVKLIEIAYSLFNTDANNRLLRAPVADKEIVRKALGL